MAAILLLIAPLIEDLGAIDFPAHAGSIDLGMYGWTVEEVLLSADVKFLIDNSLATIQIDGEDLVDSSNSNEIFGDFSADTNGINITALTTCVDDIKEELYGVDSLNTVTETSCTTAQLSNQTGNSMAEVLYNFTAEVTETITLNSTINVVRGDGGLRIYNTSPDNLAVGSTQNSTEHNLIGSQLLFEGSPRANPTTQTVSYNFNVVKGEQYMVLMFAGGGSTVDVSCLDITYTKLTLREGLTKDVEQKLTSDTLYFTQSNWVDSGSYYEIVHTYDDLTNVKIPEYAQLASGCFLDYEINSLNKTITIRINKYPDNRFDGSLIITGK